METIIGLLFILLPVIFKLISRKLEKAGQAEKAGRLKELAEMIGAFLNAACTSGISQFTYC